DRGLALARRLVPRVGGELDRGARLGLLGRLLRRRHLGCLGGGLGRGLRRLGLGGGSLEARRVRELVELAAGPLLLEDEVGCEVLARDDLVLLLVLPLPARWPALLARLRGLLLALGRRLILGVRSRLLVGLGRRLVVRLGRLRHLLGRVLRRRQVLIACDLLL